MAMEVCMAGGMCGRGVCVAMGVCMAGVGACMAGECVAMGACMAGTCVVGGMHCRGVCVAMGVCMAGGMHVRGCVCGRRDGHCSGRYASYWNAFLLMYSKTSIALKNQVYGLHFLILNSTSSVVSSIASRRRQRV